VFFEALLEKLRVPQPVKKFSTFHRSRSVHYYHALMYLALSYMNSVHNVTLYALRSILI
jgi:hypothetical protein